MKQKLMVIMTALFIIWIHSKSISLINNTLYNYSQIKKTLIKEIKSNKILEIYRFYITCKDKDILKLQGYRTESLTGFDYEDYNNSKSNSNIY